MKNALARGIDFAITPSKVPIEEIISHVELSISNMDDKDSNQIRLQITRNMKKTQLPKSNLSYSEPSRKTPKYTYYWQTKETPQTSSTQKNKTK